MVSNGDINVIQVNTLTRKIPYGRMPRRIIVVGVPREYVSIVYRE